MTAKLIVGPFGKGLRTDVEPFFVDNDSFPTLINAYQWRGRIKRKRGTSFLTRLRRYFDSLNASYSSITTVLLNGSGVVNILTGFGLQVTGNIIPGTVTITIGANVYTDTDSDGILYLGAVNSGTIVYSTGVITIPTEAGNNASVVFSYYPVLPVMGLRDFVRLSNQFPGTIAFDTKYSYNIQTASPYFSYDVSFYKNPPTGTYPGYVEKTTVTPTSWNGQDYQLFWTVTYQGAMWATNGITVPFTTTNIGMQYKPITNIGAIVAGPPATANITILNHGLSVGDFLFINEVVGVTGINWQTGYVIAVVGPNIVTVEFPNATLGGAYVSGGIAQYLTNRSDITVDNIRWYDGDPTDGVVSSPSLIGHKGWVNFMPPLSQAPYSIADLPPDIYYLVGARMIVPFRDRLLFLGPVVQTSAAGSQRYLPDTIIYSENGTPYYTASFTGDPRTPTNTPANSLTGILLPDNQTAFPAAFFEDTTGFGGFVSAGLDEQILTCNSNEDALIIGFNTNQARLVYTGNDIVPFQFYLINSELGSSSTFSTINMDRGVITRGSRGFIITSQTEARRIDLDIPDQVFQIRMTDNGPERITAIRDYVSEWMYFTYPGNEESSPMHKFPTETLLYNYRDESWAIFREMYTSYGIFRKQTGFTWNTVGSIYPTWSSWNDPWNAGTSTLLQPEVIAGNSQGFVITRADGTDESKSLTIASFSGSTVTSYNHCLNEGDYIEISDALGTISSEVNGKIFSVAAVTQNTFVLNPTIDSGTYFGEGLIKRLYVPFVQTKQFPMAWQDARKTRIGVQRYLLTKTQTAQMQLLIYLSQDADDPFNDGPLVPNLSSLNDALIYSTVLFTCPESTNLGLTPANTNIMMPTATQQSQIWHRINTSLIGDTVQLGFTLSDAQMRDYQNVSEAFEITGASQTNPCVLNCITSPQFPVGSLIRIEGVEGMEELNFDASEYNYYYVLESSPTTLTIDVDATGFTAYEEGGTAQRVSPVNQTAEIELHGFIIDLTPSQMLV